MDNHSSTISICIGYEFWSRKVFRSWTIIDVDGIWRCTRIEYGSSVVHIHSSQCDHCIPTGCHCVLNICYHRLHHQTGSIQFGHFPHRRIDWCCDSQPSEHLATDDSTGFRDQRVCSLNIHRTDCV